MNSPTGKVYKGSFDALTEDSEMKAPRPK